jgi:hypothetical protein
MNTTCLIGVGSPGRSGTGRAATSARGAADGGSSDDEARIRRLFCATEVVYAASSASVGTSTTLTEPRTAWT